MVAADAPARSGTVSFNRSRSRSASDNVAEDHERHHHDSPGVALRQRIGHGQRQRGGLAAGLEEDEHDRLAPRRGKMELTGAEIGRELARLGPLPAGGDGTRYRRNDGPDRIAVARGLERPAGRFERFAIGARRVAFADVDVEPVEPRLELLRTQMEGGLDESTLGHFRVAVRTVERSGRSVGLLLEFVLHFDPRRRRGIRAAVTLDG